MNLPPLAPPQFVPPTQIRLMGDTIAVTHALEVLGAVFTVANKSEFQPLTGRNVLVTATISREVPYSGGVK